MAIITYPIPYETVGVTARMTRPRWFQVADKVELEIREVESIGCLEVARANFSWPTQGLPGQGDYNENNLRHGINPGASIRMFENSLFVPVRKFSLTRYQDEETETVAAKPTEVASSIGSFEYALAHPFERLYREEAQHNNGLYSKDLYGRLVPLEKLKLTGDSEVKARRARDEAIAAAKDDLSAYLVIDGELWRRLFKEPVISLSATSTAVDIKLVTGTDAGADKTEYFNINQLDDCLEFAELKYPGWKVRQHFTELCVSTPEAFTFDGERDAVWRAARNIERAIGRGAAWLESGFEKAFNKLHELVWEQKNADVDVLVTCLKNLEDTWNDEGLTSVARESRQLLTLALSRWEMRPIKRDSLRL